MVVDAPSRSSPSRAGRLRGTALRRHLPRHRRRTNALSRWVGLQWAHTAAPTSCVHQRKAVQAEVLLRRRLAC
jgi:hypothetical protein